MDVDSCEQVHRLLVLHEKVVELSEHLGRILESEENLSVPEYAGYAVNPRSSLAHASEEEIPELVFDEDGDFRFDDVEESVGSSLGVERDIADDIGSFIVFPHFVARWGEEGEQDFVLRMVLPDEFHEWASLLKFSE